MERLEDRSLLSVMANLPVAAQYAISSAIGQDQSAYHAASGAAGLTLVNPANGFTAEVQSGALHVSVGSDTWDMTLEGLGYGGAMQPVGTDQTSVSGNRVDCNYGTIDVWYVNGPVGLEQGFNVAPPQSGATGPLTVALALGGDLTAVVNATGGGLTLSRPDHSTALSYTGLVAYDATGKALPASLEVRTAGGRQQLWIDVDAAGARGQITIDPFVKLAELTASDGRAGDLFGSSVSISGNTVVVGAPDAYATSIYGNSQQGEAYVFTEPGSGWANMTQTAILTASDGRAGDLFGSSVSISGNTVVVGAPDAYTSPFYGSTQQGEAYVFTEPGSGWANMTQTAILTESNGRAGDLFGSSVSINGKTVVVGAPDAYTTPFYGGTQQGQAYVFTAPGSGWANMIQTAILNESDGRAGDLFGSSVSISGSTVVVGAPDAYATSFYGNSQQGEAYVFTEPGSGWVNTTQTAILTATDGRGGDLFGSSVSISGNTMVVGAPDATTYSLYGYLQQGEACVFTAPGSGWADMTQTAILTASDGRAGDLFGSSVSISGNTVLIGAPDAYATSFYGNSRQGEAYVFTAPGSGWANMFQTAVLVTLDGRQGDLFGSSVSINGNTMLIGVAGRIRHVVLRQLPAGRGLRIRRPAQRDWRHSQQGAFGGWHERDDHGDEPGQRQ